MNVGQLLSHSRAHSVVVDDLDLVSVPIAPLEADPPLVVDTDAVLARPLAAQALQPVPRGDLEILKSLGVVQHPKLPTRHLLNVARQPPGDLSLPDLLD